MPGLANKGKKGGATWTSQQRTIGLIINCKVVFFFVYRVAEKVECSTQFYYLT